MAIRKRGGGWQIDYFDPTGKRVRKSFTKKKDAEAELAKRVSLIAEKRYLDVKKDYMTTLEQIITKYEENYRDQPSFDSTKRFCLTRFRESFGKDTRAENIRYVDVETYQKHLKRLPTRNGTVRTDAAVNREISCLRHMFNKAVEWEMIESSPFNRGKSLIIKENNQRLRFLSEEEAGRLLAECPRHLKQIVVCALNTGMRKGEILKLKWSQIKNGLIYLQKTKTNNPRQIPVNDTLEDLFREIRVEQGLGGEYVFMFTPGECRLKGSEPLRIRNDMRPLPARITCINVSFHAALSRAGIEDFKFHDLRHTFASWLIMNGANLKTVQELLGHKNIAMTMRYAHLSQQHKKEAVNLLNGMGASKNPTCHKSVTRLDVISGKLNTSGDKEYAEGQPTS
jgi:integrase